MSEVRSNKFLNSSGLYGTALSSNGFSTLYYDGWEIKEDAGCLYPLNKTKITFSYTGSDQSWTVPAGVNYIFAKVWGAGGGHGRAGGWSYGADGGGGGHSRGLIPVTPGTSLTIKVGQGGRTAAFGAGYGGGGAAGVNSDITYGGTGGGGAYIFNASTPLIIAGGGGGGGSSRVWTGLIGGAGGGIVGQQGQSPYDGKTGHGGTGGTQSAGGQSTSVGGSTIGSQYQGGNSSTSSYGGGGGGGYYGGGGGAYSEANTMGGAGGGSGYLNETIKFGGTFTGNFREAAISWDTDLNKSTPNNYATIAYGSQNLQNNIGTGTLVGGNAVVIIYY
jgi:hypothetical protein